MDTKALVAGLCRKHGTRDPFVLADALGIRILCEPLGAIFGYYNCAYRQRFIHINDSITDWEQRFTCAHELGHAMLHPALNTSFLQKHTLFSVDKLESQANRFAVDLLYPDSDLQPYLTRPITAAAAAMQISVPLAKYRMSTVCPTLTDWSDT